MQLIHKQAHTEFWRNLIPITKPNHLKQAEEYTEPLKINRKFDKHRRNTPLKTQEIDKATQTYLSGRDDTANGGTILWGQSIQEAGDRDGNHQRRNDEDNTSHPTYA